MGPPLPVCAEDSQCQNGLFCDGIELCRPSGPDADSFGCAPSSMIACAIAEVCDEAMDRCATVCELAPDADGDGQWSIECGGEDCDDSRSEVHPGAVEVCNGHDDDCDGNTDDLDADGDGHRPTACGGDDCDDTSDAILPGATELCNAVDDDCDGAIDDGVPGVGTSCGTSLFSCTPRRTCVAGALTCVGTVVTAAGRASAPGLPSDPTTLARAVANAAAQGGGDVCVIGAESAPVPVPASISVPPGVRILGTNATGTARAYAYLSPATDVRISIEGTDEHPSAIYDIALSLVTASVWERIAARGNVTLDSIRFRGEWDSRSVIGIDVRGPATLRNVYATGSDTGVRVRGAPGVAQLSNVSGWAHVALDLSDVVVDGAIGIPNPGTLTYGHVYLHNATGIGRLVAYHAWGGGGPTWPLVRLTGDLTGLDLEASATMDAETGTMFSFVDCVGNPRIAVLGGRGQRSPRVAISNTFVRATGPFCEPTIAIDVDTTTETNCAADGCTAVDCSEAPCTVESLSVRSAGGMTALRCSAGGCRDVAGLNVDDSVTSVRPASPLIELFQSSPRITRGLIVRRTTVLDGEPLVSVIDGAPSMTNVQASRIGPATAPVLLHQVTDPSSTLTMSYCGLTQSGSTMAVPALLESIAPAGVRPLAMSDSILAFAPATPTSALPMARLGPDGAASFSRIVFGNANGTPLVGVGGTFLMSTPEVDSASWADGSRAGPCTVAGSVYDCPVAIDAGDPVGAPTQDRVRRARPQGAGFDVGPIELR